MKEKKTMHKYGNIGHQLLMRILYIITREIIWLFETWWQYWNIKSYTFTCANAYGKAEYIPAAFSL